MMSFPPDYFAGKRVTVMGLGHFGGQIAVIKYLASQGALITVTDTTPAEKLKKSLNAISDCNVIFHLGGHVESDFTDTDLIVVSPAVPKASRYLKLAVQNGITVTSEMNLFLDRCRAKVLAVTGTVGKSTTVAMIDSIFKVAEDADFPMLGYRKSWCGGNIGKSLLGDLPRIQSTDLVVLELSSFQLEDMSGIEFSPHIGLVTNLHPNHLDRHGTMEKYIDAKANITRFQQPGDFLLTRQDDEHSERICEISPSHVNQWEFGSAGDKKLKVQIQKDRDESFSIQYLREESGLWEPLIHSHELSVPGEHNIYNAAGAVLMGLAVGLSPSTIAEGLRRFKGLPDRLELVGECDSVRWFNDSKSTTPEAGIVALKAFAPGTILAIAGGYDKGLDLDDFARELAERCAETFCLGQTGEVLAQKIGGFGGKVRRVESLEQAVTAIAEIVKPGQTVVLSPGCSSWDMYENYQARGKEFRELVRKILCTENEPCGYETINHSLKSVSGATPIMSND